MKRIWMPVWSALATLIALAGLVLAFLQSDFWKEYRRGHVTLAAYYAEGEDGRCSLDAFSVENNMNVSAANVRVTILADYLVNNGTTTLAFETRRTGLIGSGEIVPIPYREDLGIAFSNTGNTIVIQTLSPGEYVDLFRFSGATAEIAEIRRALSLKDPQGRFTPRIANAGSDAGRVVITNYGECYHET